MDPICGRVDFGVLMEGLLFGRGLERCVELEIAYLEQDKRCMARLNGHEVLTHWMLEDGICHDFFDHIRELPAVPGEIHAFAVADYLSQSDWMASASLLKDDLVDRLIDEFEEDLSDVLRCKAPLVDRRFVEFAKQVINEVTVSKWYTNRSGWTDEVKSGFREWYAAGRADAEMLYGSDTERVVELQKQVCSSLRDVFRECRLSRCKRAVALLSGSLDSGWSVRLEMVRGCLYQEDEE